LKYNPIMKKLFTALLFLTWSSFSFSDVYITDQLDLPIRSDKSFGENIIRLLPSGTKLSLIQNTEDGWSQVKFGNTTGWIKSFYLSSKPTAINQLKTLVRTDQANKLLIENLLSKNDILSTEVKTLKTQIEFLEIRKQALSGLDSNVEMVEELVSESDALAQAALKELEKAKKKRQEAQEKAQIAEEKRKLEEERVKLAKERQVFENEQYNRLITQEVQAEQEQERLIMIEEQLNTLRSAYVANLAARIKSNWHYQSAEDFWTAEVYVIQDRDGTVKAVNVRNTNVGDTNKAKAFEDSIKRAVFKSSPLPKAPIEDVFDNEFIVLFSVN
jgi:SH3 domain protein